MISKFDTQITQIIMNVRWRLRNLSGLILRSLLG